MASNPHSFPRIPRVPALRGAGRDERVDSGHTVVCIDHNLAVLAHADHAIDLGPGAGSAGGQLVFSGTPADLAEQQDSVTGRFLADALVSP